MQLLIQEVHETVTCAEACYVNMLAQAYAALAADGAKRCTEIPFFKLLVLSLYAGFYVSFGGLVATSVVTLLPGQHCAELLPTSWSAAAAWFVVSRGQELSEYSR